MSGSVVLTLVVFTVVLVRSFTVAIEYIVGDGYCSDQGYCNYQLWADNKIFYVGDVIVFRFSMSSSTVAQVTEADFNGCANGLLPAKPIVVYTTSPLYITLSKVGRLYFANTIGSCRIARVPINVVNSSPTQPSPDEPLTSPPPPPPPVSSTSPSHSVKYVSCIKRCILELHKPVFLLLGIGPGEVAFSVA